MKGIGTSFGETSLRKRVSENSESHITGMVIKHTTVIKNKTVMCKIRYDTKLR